MIKKIIIILLIFVSTIYSKTPEKADSLFSKGKELHSIYKYKKAITNFKSAVRIEKILGLTRRINLRNNYEWLGKCHNRLNQYNKAIEYYKKALTIDTKLNNKKNIASDLNLIGLMHYKNKDFMRAIKYFQMAHRMAEKLNLRKNEATYLNNI